MFTSPPTVHVTAKCSFCHAHNALTINSVDGGSIVNCSTCGGRLGTVDELKDLRPQKPRLVAGRDLEQLQGREP